MSETEGTLRVKQWQSIRQPIILFILAGNLPVVPDFKATIFREIMRSELRYSPARMRVGTSSILM